MASMLRNISGTVGGAQASRTRAGVSAHVHEHDEFDHRRAGVALLIWGVVARTCEARGMRNAELRNNNRPRRLGSLHRLLFNRLVVHLEQLRLVEDHLLPGQAGGLIEGRELDGIARAGFLAHAAVDAARSSMSNCLGYFSRSGQGDSSATM